jgi:hypothetical protein
LIAERVLAKAVLQKIVNPCTYARRIILLERERFVQSEQGFVHEFLKSADGVDTATSGVNEEFGCIGALRCYNPNSSFQSNPSC